jgi:hypothetical protein
MREDQVEGVYEHIAARASQLGQGYRDAWELSEIGKSVVKRGNRYSEPSVAGVSLGNCD